MTLERHSRDKKSVDPATGKWPHAVEKAARISDLIAALEQVRSDEGDIEVLGRRFVTTEDDGWSEIEPLWDVSDIMDVVANPHVTETEGVAQDGTPVANNTVPNLRGRFLMVELGL